jgi:penicillin-binding protein 2
MAPARPLADGLTKKPPMNMHLRNHDQEIFWFQRRLIVAGVLMLLCFCVLATRFVYLQVMRHDHYTTLSEANRIDLQPEAPNRGIITDRNGVVLASNYSAYTVELNPQKIENMDAMIEEIARLVDVTARDRRRFKRLVEEFRSAESLPLKSRLTDEEVARVAANRFRLPGVEIKARLFRQYPFGEVASHVIGYIGRINPSEKERIEAQGLAPEYKGSDYMGKVGIELSYERELRGVSGATEVEVDASRRVIRVLSRKPSTPGNNLQLSLDIRLQKIAEDAFGEKRGALIAIEPSTGDVLAFVSKPGYDPNLFVDGIDPQSWDALNTSPDKPLLNRPLRGAYPPGSTYKPFMALMAQELGLRSASQTISDPGYFRLGAGYWRDDKAGGHGLVDLPRSIAISCDTYYYQLAAELDVDEWSSFMKHFGFGQKTGIDIDGELQGVLPTREWKAKRFPKDPKLHVGDQISLGIGQGFNTFTPLQLAYATAILANRGVAFKPHLVKRVQDAKTGQSHLTQPAPAYTIPLKEAHIDAVKRGMAGVVTEGTGATAFRGANYTSGGKTGTAQVFGLRGGNYVESQVSERLRDHAWYIAFAPLETPKIAVTVFVENGGFGAASAAPIARKVLDAYFDPAVLAAAIKPPKGSVQLAVVSATTSVQAATPTKIGLQ